MSLLRVIPVAFLATGILAGCGGASDAPTLYKVSGTLTFEEDNSPVPNATITFVPENGGPTSSARTDESGAFTLRVPTGQSGAVAGKHKITVVGGAEVPKDPQNDLDYQKRMMERYGGGAGGSGRGSADPGEMEADVKVADKYKDPKGTPLSFEVTTSGHDGIALTVTKS